MRPTHHPWGAYIRPDDVWFQYDQPPSWYRAQTQPTQTELPAASPSVAHISAPPSVQTLPPNQSVSDWHQTPAQPKPPPAPAAAQAKPPTAPAAAPNNFKAPPPERTWGAVLHLLQSVSDWHQTPAQPKPPPAPAAAQPKPRPAPAAAQPKPPPGPALAQPKPPAVACTGGTAHLSWEKPPAPPGPPPPVPPGPPPISATRFLGAYTSVHTQTAIQLPSSATATQMRPVTSVHTQTDPQTDRPMVSRKALMQEVEERSHTQPFSSLV